MLTGFIQKWKFFHHLRTFMLFQTRKTFSFSRETHTIVAFKKNEKGQWKFHKSDSYDCMLYSKSSENIWQVLYKEQTQNEIAVICWKSFLPLQCIIKLNSRTRSVWFVNELFRLMLRTDWTNSLKISDSIYSHHYFFLWTFQELVWISMSFPHTKLSRDFKRLEI